MALANAVGRCGDSLLQRAVQRLHRREPEDAFAADTPDIVQMLLAAGASVNVRHVHIKKTPLHWAVYQPRVRIIPQLTEQETVVQQLLAAGADVNAAAFGRNPLHEAVSLQPPVRKQQPTWCQ
jgi:ankyrin repeat protein